MASVSAAVLAWALAFASASSGLPVPPDAAPPRVTISSRATLGHYADGDQWLGATRWWTVPVEIELHAGWRESDRQDRCILAHEFTHYLQEVNGRRYDPITRAEPLAYRTTAQCFEALGADAGDVRWAWRQVARYGGLPGRLGRTAHRKSRRSAGSR